MQQLGIGQLAEDVVRRQQSRIVGFGEGEDAIALDRRLEDTLQRWALAAGLTAALFLPMWRLLPAVVPAVALCAAMWLRSVTRTRGALMAAAMAVALLVFVGAGHLLHTLPLPVAFAGSAVIAWGLSKPIARLWDHDRPAHYWVAVAQAEAAAPHPVPDEED